MPQFEPSLVSSTHAPAQRVAPVGQTLASAAVSDALRGMARPVSSRSEKVQVATVSAHGDATLGELVGDAVHRVGGDGVVTVEEARATETSIEIVEGMRFDRGFLSPYFVTSTERMECSLDHPYVLVTDRRVGAPSERELKQRKEAVEDAIRSTQAAVAEGIVPGGGVALARAGAAVIEVERGLEGDRLTGARILRTALVAPLRQIATNSGADPGVVLEHVLAGSGAFGFDAATGRYGDLIEAGIVDPVQVVRIAPENEVSVAGTRLPAEATMTEREDDAENPAAPDGET